MHAKTGCSSMVGWLSAWMCQLLLFIFIAALAGCNHKNPTLQPNNDTVDIEKDGITQFVETNYIELSKIYRISKFRSSVGHDYSDAFEHCRSMKHYFEPRPDVDWSTIKIYSPVSGTITRVENEWAGVKLEIESDQYPAYRFSIFHINSTITYNMGDKVVAGQQLGVHIGSQTMSDISVLVNDPTRQGRMISYVDVMTDALFTQYRDRGLTSRAELTISKEIRDANPLSCNGDTFTSGDSLENWVILR
jgi:hypothetical protein